MPDLTILHDLNYRRVGELALALDLYLPAGAPPRPLVIWVHGGAWRQGSKDNPPAVPLLTDAGFAVASISYRLSQVAQFPAQIVDCKAAVAWLRAHAGEYGLAADRFGAWGSSAGGHLVALLGVAGDRAEFQPPEWPEVSTRVQAVCDWYGPTDFLQMDAHEPPGAARDHDQPDSPESQLIGGPIQANAAAVQRANPVTYVTADAPPFLVMHGTQDPLVPIHQSELLVAALRAAGRSVEFVRLEGAGHGGPAFQRPEALARVRAFFLEQLMA